MKTGRNDLSFRPGAVFKPLIDMQSMPSHRGLAERRLKRRWIVWPFTKFTAGSASRHTVRVIMGFFHDDLSNFFVKLFIEDEVTAELFGGEQ